MSIANMKPNSSSVMVTESNLPTGIIFKNKHLITNINCWHKFIVNNSVNDSRNNILRTVLDHVHPLDLIPVAFGKDQFGSYFLARNCGAAIQKLCKDNLTVPNPNNSRPFKLTIILKFATTSEFKIDVQRNIQSVLNQHYDAAKRTLNLVNFHEDPDLSEFCPLSQPKIMFFVLHLSKTLSPSPEVYLLSKNRIKVLNPLEAVSGTSVISLDLSNNLIADSETLQSLKLLKLQELILDGNPICENYTSESYINEIKLHCKGLQKLDGIPLRAGHFPISKKNFLYQGGVDIVNQFLEHYYFHYDSRNRRNLQDMYHQHAMFSINTHYHHGQISSLSSELRPYSNIARNFKKVADLSRNNQFLFRGNSKILDVLVGLPYTEHDPYTFKVDLMYNMPKCAVIGISGVFKELPRKLLDPERHYGFRRTFVLEIVNGDGLTYIVNEMFHVHNALSFQVIESFKVAKPTVVTDDIRPPQTDKECQQVVDTLRIITNLNVQWARKCLEECQYDLKKGLSLFVELYKADKIPKEAFLLKKSVKAH